jgi:hypothetical protein
MIGFFEGSHNASLDVKVFVFISKFVYNLFIIFVHTYRDGRNQIRRDEIRLIARMEPKLYLKKRYKLLTGEVVPKEENIVKLSKGKVYYELAGPEEGELVVLLHGITWWSFTWIHTVPVLTQRGFRVLTFGKNSCNCASDRDAPEIILQK